MSEEGPSYVDTLSNLFNSNRSNSRAPTGFEALNELAKVTVTTSYHSSTIHPSLEDDDGYSTHASFYTPTTQASFPVSNPSPVAPTFQTTTMTSIVSTLTTEIINATITAATTTVPSSTATTTTTTLQPLPDLTLDASIVNSSQRLGLTAFIFTVVIIGVLVNSYTVHLLLTSAQLQLRWHWWNITVFNLTMVDLISCILHATTMLVHSDALMMWDPVGSKEGAAAVTHRSLGHPSNKELEESFYCKFQFVVNFTCFVVPTWILVVGLVERLLALGWSSQYNDLLSYAKLHILFICSWTVSIVAAGYSAVPDDWIIYNPTTGFCILNLQNPVGFPWFMLCFFYFVVLPIVLIIPLVIFILSDIEARQNARLAAELGQSTAPDSHHVGWANPVHGMPSAAQGQQVPRIQISEIMQWHSRRSSCSEPDEERGGGTGAAEGGAAPGTTGTTTTTWHQKLWIRVKGLNIFKSSSRSPVQQIRNQGRPKAPPPRQPPRPGATAASAASQPPPASNVVDPYGGRLFSMTQVRPNLRHETATELSLTNPQIMSSLLAVLVTLIVLKTPTGLLAICKMFATGKNNRGNMSRVSNDYAYAEIVTLCMYFVGCIVNPFVYMIMRKDFREAVVTWWSNCMYTYW